MEKVLTITDWYDGPVKGLALYNKQIVIFERIFSEEIDEYTKDYYLTPVSEEDCKRIMIFWNNWCVYVCNGYYGEFNENNPMNEILNRSTNLHLYKKEGQFIIGNRFDINCEKWVEWNDC